MDFVHHFLYAYALGMGAFLFAASNRLRDLKIKRRVLYLAVIRRAERVVPAFSLDGGKPGT